MATTDTLINRIFDNRYRVERRDRPVGGLHRSHRHEPGVAIDAVGELGEGYLEHPHAALDEPTRRNLELVESLRGDVGSEVADVGELGEDGS